MILMRPKAPRSRRRFNWAWVLVPLVVIGAIWLISGVRVAFSWEDVMCWLGVVDRERYSRLAAIALAIVGIVAIARVFRKGGDS